MAWILFNLFFHKEKFYREILQSQRRMSTDDGLGSSGPLGLLPINPFPFLFIYKGYETHYKSIIGQMTVVSNKILTGNPWRQRELEMVLKWERKLSDLSDSQVINLHHFVLSHKIKMDVQITEEEPLMT
jgi:hypothetical protein